MTPDRFAFALRTLRWNASGVAVWAGWPRQKGMMWARGKERVPDLVARWLEDRLAGRLEEPPDRPVVRR